MLSSSVILTDLAWVYLPSGHGGCHPLLNNCAYLRVSSITRLNVYTSKLPVVLPGQRKGEMILQLKTGSLDAAYFRQKFGIELTRLAPRNSSLKQSVPPLSRALGYRSHRPPRQNGANQ